jgi:4-amino-4-deoxy-L-arabinose transferase-like glycosyltransferase
MTTTQPAIAQPRRLLHPPLLLERLRPRAPLAALLVLSGIVYFWGLSRLGYANDFYAAAVQAGTKSWKAFFFGSFDSASFITVDKPPASLWLMELSGRIFGFSSFSMLLPQALEGIAAVALLYATVRRWFSTSAAFLAGLMLAVTPVAAVMFRYNNPDALLVLLLVSAAYALTRALERASTLWLALAGVAIGFGFLTKMLQAFLVLPAFALVYLVAAPTGLRRRIGQVLLAGLAIVLSAGWWVAAVALTPASSRPYVGGSTNNSILDLIWGYNGLGRLESSTGGAGGGLGFSGAPGWPRLFNSQMGGQISWLLPAALIVLAAGLVATRRAPRTDRTRAALLLWGGWLVVTAALFSFMSGIIHPYYTNVLAPPIAALAGAGGVELWRRRRSPLARLTLAAAIGVTAWWSYRLLERTPSWHPELRYAILAAGAVAIVGIALPHRLGRAAIAAVVAAGLVAVLGGAAGYTASTVASRQSGAIVSAGPAVSGGSGARPAAAGFGGAPAGAPPQRAAGALPAQPPPGSGGPPQEFGGGGARPAGGTGGTTSAALTKLLAASPSSYTWVAATQSSMSAAPLELATGRAVMAIGGFNGGDQAITLARFKALVAAGKIHYYVGGGNGGGNGANGAIESWVSATFKSSTVGGTTVYDLSS